MKRVVFLIALLLLIGQGCVQPFADTQETAEPTGTPSPEGFVAFREGFGSLPGPVPAMPDKNANAPQITWDVELPQLPPDVTVLRKHKTLPEAGLLQNITSALSIPAGALRRDPVARAFKLEWVDDQQYQWAYDGQNAQLSFLLPERIEAPLTLSQLPSDEELVGIVETFLSERGLSNGLWGKPSLHFSWNTWWQQESDAGRCMSIFSVNTVRSVADDPDITFADAPRLPPASSVSCATTEFPRLHLVRMILNQDGLPAFHADGSPVIAAEFVIDANANRVERGMLQLTKDADRSNYLAISLQTFVERLREGGLRGTSGISQSSTIVLDTLESAFYEHVTNVNGEERRYYVPAIHGAGTVTHANGLEEPYSTIVPLVADDQYATGD